MDSGIFLFLASNGYIEDRISPIIQGGEASVANYINPIPAGLVLTGIVVSVSVTAVLLALTVRLYLRYHTLELDEIIAKARTEDEQ
jgi:multicomponent Na+:H+ antiporter subunit C